MNCYGTLLHKITPGIYYIYCHQGRIYFICTEQQQTTAATTKYLVLTILTLKTPKCDFN